MQCDVQDWERGVRVSTRSHFCQSYNLRPRGSRRIGTTHIADIRRYFATLARLKFDFTTRLRPFTSADGLPVLECAAHVVGMYGPLLYLEIVLC